MVLHANWSGYRPREREIMRLVADGHSNKEIARSWASAIAPSRFIAPRDAKDRGHQPGRAVRLARPPACSPGHRACNRRFGSGIDGYNCPVSEYVLVRIFPA